MLVVKTQDAAVSVPEVVSAEFVLKVLMDITWPAGGWREVPGGTSRQGCGSAATLSGRVAPLAKGV